jgi:hypothetical protein
VSETDISRSIRKALTLAGYHVERVNSGKVPTRNGYFQGASPGTPDTVVLAPYGWLETKTPIGKLNENQKKWHARAEKLGVRVAVVRSASDAIRAVDKWAQGGDA